MSKVIENDLIRVQFATLKDIKEVAVLFNAYRLFYEQQTAIDACERFLTQRIQHEESIILVAYHDDHMVGFCQLYPTFCSVDLCKTYILYDLFVNQASRGLGAGEALLTMAVTVARQQGALRLELTTAKDNFNAQALYERLGWVRDEVFLTYKLTVR